MLERHLLEQNAYATGKLKILQGQWCLELMENIRNKYDEKASG